MKVHSLPSFSRTVPWPVIKARFAIGSWFMAVDNDCLNIDNTAP
jgi:hypothetical protein